MLLLITQLPLQINIADGLLDLALLNQNRLLRPNDYKTVQSTLPPAPFQVFVWLRFPFNNYTYLSFVKSSTIFTEQNLVKK